MQPEEYTKIKGISTPEGCKKLIAELQKQFTVVLTSEIIQHKEDQQAHFYATLIKKEPPK